MSREVAGAPTHFGVLHRAREAYRARLSASAGCGRARRSRWWSRMGGRRPELPGERAPSIGGNGERWCGCCCAWAREREREREWTSASGSGGEDRRGRAHLVAGHGASKSPHARHAAAERCRRAMASRRGRPRVWTRRWRGRGEGGDARAGWAGFGQRARSEAAAC